MKRNYLFLYFIVFVYCFNITSKLSSQNFNQLLIDNDSVENNIRPIPGTLMRLDAFGNFKYNLFLLDSKNIKRVKYGELSGNLGSTKLIWDYVINYPEEDMLLFFPVLNTELGKFMFLKIDYQKYLPIAFMNDDTLIVRSKSNKKFMGYRMSDNNIVILPNKLNMLLQKIPDFYKDYRYKVNNSLDKIVLTSDKDNESKYFKIIYIEKDSIIIKKVDNSKIYKLYGVNDIKWIDKDNLLLFLLKAGRYEPTSCQKVYNVKTENIIDIKLADKNFDMTDYNNGYCLYQKSKTTAYIYKMVLKEGKIILSKRYQITANDIPNDPLFGLGFISKDKIARITYIEGEIGFFDYTLNLKGNCRIKMDIKEISNTP